jgi:hypothetical protein
MILYMNLVNVLRIGDLAAIACVVKNRLAWPCPTGSQLQPRILDQASSKQWSSDEPDPGSSSTNARDGMAFVDAVMCAGASGPSEPPPSSAPIRPRTAGRQPGRARLSRDIRAPLGLRLRLQPKRARGTTTHARMRLECPRSIMEIERGGRRRAGRCPSHVAPCSRRDRRGGRMCVHAACCCVVPVSHRPQATGHRPQPPTPRHVARTPLPARRRMLP